MFKKELLEIEEECWMCGREVPEGHIVLRHEETNNVLCLICITEIAEVND
jgi:hypothetical protein